jgi:hypothetical protein
MSNVNPAVIVFVLIALCAIGALTYMLLECKKKLKGEGFCQGIGNKVCTNRPLLHKLYNEGKLTEFTDFGNQPREFEEMEWNKFTPYKQTQRRCQ